MKKYIFNNKILLNSISSLYVDCYLKFIISIYPNLAWSKENSWFSSPRTAFSSVLPFVHMSPISLQSQQWKDCMRFLFSLTLCNSCISEFRWLDFQMAIHFLHTVNFYSHLTLISNMFSFSLGLSSAGRAKFTILLHSSLMQNVSSGFPFHVKLNPKL